MTKKNRLNRLLSALLALVMILSLFPLQTFATEEDTTEAESIQSATETDTLPEEKSATKG